MKINKTHISILLMLLSFSGYTQRYPHGYIDYPFIEKDKNRIHFSDSENWNSFFKKANLQWTQGDQRINIVHFGGSHVQADVWTNRMRQHFQNISPYNNSGRGMLFPFRLISSNGSPYLKSSYSGKWIGNRNSVSFHTPPFGLLGARATFIDSISIINFWVNKEHCTDCVFDQLDVFYSDSMNNYCIEFLNDTLKWIKENNDLGITSFKLSKPKDSISISIKKLDTLNSKFDLFGVGLNNNNYGFCYTSVGVNGASVPSYLRCEKLQDQLDRIYPDLVIFSIGINDAYEPSFSKEKFMQNYDSIIQIVKENNPNAAILLTTNNDSYYKRKVPNERGIIVQEAMFELAKIHSCAVWDFFEIMGGLNSILIWEKYSMAKKDKIHLTTNGYKLVGDLLFEAIMKSYKNFLQTNG